ncbi:MAG: DUF475 domain-containing protein [Candidatus Buchananbacteria bacterium]|nr:DUF475 domain-containing protein [Candidatus Buchananbacteria bacterium]
MIFTILVTIIGLCLFEIISSIDNAVINAHVLKTMPEKYRRIFLFWGIIFAVFVVRGILPFLIVWLANPELSIVQVVTFVFHPNPEIEGYVNQSKSLLLLGGGVYLFFVFLGWLFLEEKKYAFLAEKFMHRQGIWFYAIASIFITTVIYFSLKINPILALSASIGASAFFITDGFKKNAEEQEKKLLNPNSHLSAWSKILYLEILDASFSIDGVIGAFAFTISIPLIILGNGIGAFVVREVTVKGINLISRLAYLKNGAMYSVGMLGALMVSESFGKEYPFWLAPLVTASLLSLFLFLSFRETKQLKNNMVK